MLVKRNKFAKLKLIFQLLPILVEHFTLNILAALMIEQNNIQQRKMQ